MEMILPDEEAPLRPLTVADLPEGVKVHFREIDGTEGRMVHIYPRLAVGGAWDGREVIKFADHVREAIRNSGVALDHAPIAGQPPLSADMIYTIARDGPKATGLAFLAVALLVLLAFRNIKLAAPILGALVLGVLWMAGIMAAYDMKVNFLNFIALPITFGIGVDYSVNVIGRYFEDAKRGRASIEEALKETGGAVALCSLTTSIGYGSLLVAGSQAFVSFGLLAVLGEITCIVAALVALPAILVFMEGRRGLKVSSPGRAVSKQAALAPEHHDRTENAPRVL
jgi:predicted RND superfamily exporter protein